MVVVVEVDEVAEPEVAGERAGLGRDAFHQVAVADDRVHEMVTGTLAVAREARAREPRGERHADAVREALAERAGRRLDAGRVAVLGMTGRARVELAEVLRSSSERS